MAVFIRNFLECLRLDFNSFLSVRKYLSQKHNLQFVLTLEDRIEKLAKKEAFISLNDHKPNFNDNPTCDLIDPSKGNYHLYHIKKFFISGRDS